MKLGAIFDMDGLLIDSERVYHEVWHELAKEKGVVLEEEFFKNISGSSHAYANELIAKHYQTNDPETIHRECSKRVHLRLHEHVDVKEGVREILEYFKEKKVKLAVASSTRLAYVKHYLTQVGIIDYFDAVTSGEEVQHGKPAPDIFLLASERLGLKGEDCYVFEDGLNGLIGGKKAGCTTIMIPDRTEPSEDIIKAIDGIYTNLSEAKEAIERGAL